MDLKNTKATEPLFIANKFRNLVLASGIVKPSVESKNSLRKKTQAQKETNSLTTTQKFKKKPADQTHSLFYRKGFNSEQKVITHLRNYGWELQFQRLITSIAEIDLIFQKGHEIHLIEVKTLSDPWRSFERISEKQIQKLKMNQLYFASVFKNQFQFASWVAWVTKEKIEYVRIN